MVHGLEKFKEYFENHTNQYVFIGGAACDILMDELKVPFRATKEKLDQKNIDKTGVRSTITYRLILPDIDLR